MAKRKTQASFLKLGLLASTALFCASNSYAQTEEPVTLQDEGGEQVDEELVIDSVVVTGSNIRNSAPTFNSFSFSKLEIEKSGVTSVEQFLRRLPQSGSRTDPTVGALVGGQVGASTGRASGIDLRGLGAQNTLILVNGRRLATSSNNDTGTGVGIFTDISSIPIGSIERIDVVTEGASAIYGADAVGGVINIVLLSDFRGGSTKVRFGDSTTGLDDFSVEQTIGYSFRKLSSLFTFSYRNEARGNSDRLQSFGQDDFETFGVANNISGFFNAGSPAVVTGLIPTCDIGNGPEDCFFTGFAGFLGNRLLGFPDATQIAFPAGLGRPVTLDDAIINGIGNGEVIDPILSQGLDEFSGSVNLDYDLSEKTSLRANGFFSYRESAGTFAAPTLTTLLPFDNPNNPFGEDINIAFNFFNEIEAGLLDAPSTDSDTLTFSVGAGLTHQITKDWQFRFDGTYSRDRNRSVSRQLFPTFETFDFIEFNVDPETAVNPFGPGLFGPPELFEGLLNEVAIGSENETFQITGIVDGPLPFVKLPAGQIRTAVGLEVRGEKFDFDNEALEDPFTGEINNDFCINNSIECIFTFIDETAERDIFSVFGELNVPLINADMNIPFVQDLSVTGAARFDRYDDVEVRSRVSPSAGVRWVVNDNLQFRANYAESFRPPDVLSLNQLGLVDTTLFSGFEDPLMGNQFVFPDVVTTGGNPNLNDETGTSISLGAVFERGIGPGHFRLNFNYFINNISNQIGGISPAAQLFIFENSDQFPEFIQRDALGNVVTFNDIQINIANVDVEGYDINATYDFRIKDYDFEFNVAFTDNIQNDEEILEGIGELESFIGTDLGPEDYSLVTRFELSKANWLTAGVIGRYHPSYTFEAIAFEDADDFFAEPVDFRVDGQLLVDIYASINLGEFNDRLDGFRLAVGANNLFDPQPNFFGNSPVGLNFGRGAELRGRVAFIELSKQY